VKRKAIQLARKTLVISLPATWVKQNAIQKGDELEVEPAQHSIQISTHKETPIKSKTINAEEWQQITPRYLFSLYHTGINEFEIFFDSPKMLKKIQEVSGHMVGFETIAQRKNSVVLKEITGPSKEDFSILLRRLFFTILDIFQEGIEAMKTNDKNQMDTLILKDIEVNKFSHLCLRKIDKGDVKDEQKAKIYYFLCIILEKIADEYKEALAKHKKTKFSKKDIQLFEQINQLFRLCYEFTMSPKAKKALEISRHYDKIKERTLSPYHKSLTEFVVLIQNQQLALARS